MLFGALLIAPASTFVGCSDYDDDIAALQQQITSNATTLKELADEKLHNAEVEIEALKQANENLKAALENARETVTSGYKDADVVILDQAVASAQKLVEEAQKELQAAVDEANARIDTKADAQALLEAEARLQLAIDQVSADVAKAYDLAEEAKAKADEALSRIATLEADNTEIKGDIAQLKADLAQQKSDLEGISADLKAINESLQAQITTLDGRVTDLDERLTAELAALVSQYASLSEFLALQEKVGIIEGDIEGIEDEISGIQGNISTIKGQIEGLQGDIATVRGEIATAKSEVLSEVNQILAAYATTASVDSKISEVKGDITTAVNNQYNEKIQPLEARVTTIEQTIDGKIQGKVNELEGKVNTLLNTINLDLSRLVTGVIYQASNLNFVYDKMDNAPAGNLSNNNTVINFPYPGAVNVAKKDNNKYNVEEADGNALFITINPTNVDFSDAFKSSMALENSKGDVSSIFSIDEVAATSDYVVKTRSANNGFYAVTLKTDVNNVTYNPADVQKDHAFAICVGNKVKKNVTQEDSETENRKVYSQYAIDLGLKEATPLVAADVKLAPIGEAEALSYNVLTDFEKTGLEANLKVTARNAADATKKAYKKYLEIESGNYSNGTPVSTADITAINNANEALKNPYDGHDFAGWVAEQDGDDSNANVCLKFDDMFNGCTFVINYYVWNYDGSILKKSYNITIAKKMFADTEANFVVTPQEALNQVADSKEHSTDFATNMNWLKPGSNYNTWSTNATKFDVKVADEAGVAVSTAAFTGLTFYNKDIVPNYTKLYALTNSAATGLVLPAVAELAKFKHVTIAYDPALLTVGKVYTMTLTFYNAQGNVVNVATFKIKMNRPNPSPAIWDGLLAYVKEANNQYVAWASVSGTTGYAQNDILNNATNPLVNDGKGSKLIFKDVADYTLAANAPYEPFSTTIDASVTGNMLVPCETTATMNNAVGYEWDVYTGKEANPRHVYTLVGGVEYYALASLWNVDATLYVTYKSPIQEADWVVPTYELTYPSDGTFNTHAAVKDKSDGVHNIKFFGATGVDSRISNIQFVKTELYSTANYGLIEQYEVKHTAADEYQLYFKTRTTTTGAIPAETILPFYLKVTDVFNCEKVIVVNVKIVNPGA